MHSAPTPANASVRRPRDHNARVLSSSTTSMSLRRVAQANHAMASPRTSFSSSSTMTSPTTPETERVFPVTPKQRNTHYEFTRSPLLSPSLSEVRPFDWEAAKSNRPPPYPSPLKAKSKRQSIVPNGALGSPTKGPAKRVVRKKGLYEKCVHVSDAQADDLIPQFTFAG